MAKDPFFSSRLLKWHKTHNNREMPWKGEKDPYKIWLSEIILQQTRVDQGLAYYNRFVKAFPTIQLLAKSSEKKVLKLWEGLGYYSRCRNLIHTAKHISKTYKGKFPDDFESVSQLKGIGPYTASAICSFAFNQPYAVLDGNVFRVISRVFGITTPIDSTAGKKFFTKLANELLSKEEPALYNQAIMDLGATICKPKQPLCEQCPLAANCEARLHDAVSFLPVKGKKLQRRKRFFNYVIAVYGNGFYVRERKEKDIWQNLHEFILMETDKPLAVTGLQKKLSAWMATSMKTSAFVIEDISPTIQQELTHQVISGKFITVRLTRELPAALGYRRISKSGLRKMAFPKFIRQHLATSGMLD